jgi:D-citramalate synthase
LTEEALIARVQEVATYAKDKGLKVQIGTPQLYNSSPEYFDKLCRGVAAVGVDEIGLGGGSSAFGPEAYAYLVSRAIEMAPGVRIALSRPFNGFGLAMAQALAGIHEGAEVIEGSVNSLCTCTGQIDIAEVVAALEVLYGVKTGIKMDRLTSLRRLVEDITRVPMAQNKPVTGEHAWTYTEEANTEEDELGLYLHKCVNPTLFGNVSRLEIGRYSGTWTMFLKLKEIGVDVDKDLVPIILDEVKQEIEIRKRVLAGDDIKEIVERVKAGYR